ncbi:MAG TPA: ABC transporter ATP-binding protein [Burkholderiaceae bacterium]|nr:ABC transporter ATP-binding protein [Burkholderiaceae bacterium]
MTNLALRGVVKRFGDVVAVDDVSLEVGAGEFFTLLGPSGCGKTTLLRLIAGLEQPDAGAVLLDGVDLVGVPAERRPVHTVFQSYALFPHLSVARNIAFPLEMARVPRADIERRVAAVLDDVQLGGLARRMPDELSGGQRQRVAIARALVDRPRLLLLDEPLGALDAKLRVQMKSELVKLQREVGITFVYVTHDQGEALALSHRIAVMNRGRLEQVGDPRTIYEHPASRFVADFIGQCNLLEATVRRVDGDTMEVEASGIGVCAAPRVDGAAAGQRGTLALRPEAIEIGESIVDATGDRVQRRARVRDALYEGDVTFYTVALDDGTCLRAMQPNADARRAGRFAAGAEVGLAWPSDAGRFLCS